MGTALPAVPLPPGCLPTGAELAVGRPLQVGHCRPCADRWQQPLRHGCGRLPPLAGTALQPATLGRLPLRSGRGRAPPPCGLALAVAGRPFSLGPWLQPAAPARGLAVAMPGCPLQGLPSL
ncbi:hypothetical protein BHE74_00026179 [Ensete ventricosum]|nr:hypothetical protein BHE74_00026179 [Ensete ventricosum]